MFNTSWANQAAGVFEGKLVVSMRPYRPDQLDTVRNITSRYPLSHGAPIHAGDPQVPTPPSPCGGVCVLTPASVLDPARLSCASRAASMFAP